MASEVIRGSCKLTTFTGVIIGKECHFELIVFACERFDQYVYGRSQIESDHKPQEQIATKPFHEIPKKLQRMYLRLQKYDVKITYKRGEQLIIADAQSRA